MRQQQWFGRDLDRLLHHVFGRVRDVADEAKPVAGVNHLSAEVGEAMVGNRTGLEVADVIRRVVHELHVPDAAAVSLLEPFEVHLEKIEPLHIGDDCGLCCLVRRFEIGGA